MDAHDISAIVNAAKYDSILDLRCYRAEAKTAALDGPPLVYKLA
jgi:hypothetical protein